MFKSQEGCGKMLKTFKGPKILTLYFGHFKLMFTFCFSDKVHAYGGILFILLEVDGVVGACRLNLGGQIKFRCVPK